MDIRAAEMNENDNGSDIDEEVWMASIIVNLNANIWRTPEMISTSECCVLDLCQNNESIKLFLIHLLHS